MTVPAPLRGENRLKAHQATEKLVIHTLQITSNPKVFDPRHKSLIDRVNDMAIGIGQDVWEANGIRVNGDVRKWDVRRGLQERACRHFDVLLYLITLSRRAFHLRRGKFEHWVLLAKDAKTLVRAWADADRKRYDGLVDGKGSE